MSIATEPRRGDKELPGQLRSDAPRPAGPTTPKPSLSGPPRAGRSWRTIILAGAGIAVVALVIAATAAFIGDEGTTDQPLIYYTVQRADLPITVTERGNLESQDNIEIVCEVDDVHGDGIIGTTILSIVPNGAPVKKGDLLVELDVAMHQDRLDSQVLDYERAQAVYIQAEAKYENQKTQNVTSKAEAELQVELAQLELEMYRHKQNGTYTLEVEEINRSIDDVKNQILAAQASMELKKNEMLGIEALFRLGYAGKSELDRVRLDYLQAESQLSAQLNRLETYQASLKKKETYEHDMELLRLKGSLETARRNLDQVELNNKALTAQTEAAYKAAVEARKKEKERLERYREQVTKCKIYAPADGMAAYATSGSRWHREEIREGVQVRPQQPILSLPNLKKMQVKTSVHESVLDQIKVGLPATVRVDAFPERRYQGSVKSVAVLPDPDGWMSSDTKVYETYVTIDEEVSQLKPGMTAVVEIHVDRLTDVVSVPVQSVVQVGGESWCYVEDGGGIERRLLDLGLTNDKFVQINDGVSAGERVILNPMAIVDDTQQRESTISPDRSEKGIGSGV